MPTGVIFDGARLAALRDLGLLDTAPDADFDRYTRLATELLGVPVSLVSLVDADRQFFKSQIGLSGEFAEARQTPLSHSFCQHAVATREPLVVSDAREHPLVADNLAIRDLDVIAYAGVPLVLSDGHAVGALCAIDAKPRSWSERDIRILGDLAAAVRAHLQLRESVVAQSLHDPLTGLANRALLAARADHLLGVATAARSVGAICIGLDDFALVNEAYGAAVADALLVGVADRLAAETRHGEMLLGRLEGDTFALVTPSIGDDQAAIELAARLSARVGADPFEVDGHRISVTATAGVAIGARDGSAADLLARSRTSMRSSKASGGLVQLAPSAFTQRAASQLRLRAALARALARAEIQPAYQPIVALDDSTPVGFEALARWNSAELGPVSPAEFIPIAERTGEIVRIGELMVHSACAQLAAWREQRPDLSMSVNLAPLQLEVAGLPGIVEAALLEHDLPASALTLEVTESALIGAGTLQSRTLGELHRLGVRIALDDFGTGYSALAYLTRFPIDQIKIDRSFIHGLDGTHHNAALVKAMLALAEELSLKVVAEGIETTAQHRLLLDMGCALGQGYLFAPPRAAHAITL